MPIEEVGDLRDQRNDLIKKGIDPNLNTIAPVEGLAPVLYMRKDGVTITPSHFDSIISPKGNYDPLVTRSQASTIIAAKDAEIERLKSQIETLETQLTESEKVSEWYCA